MKMQIQLLNDETNQNKNDLKCFKILKLLKTKIRSEDLPLHLVTKYSSYKSLQIKNIEM